MPEQSTSHMSIVQYWEELQRRFTFWSAQKQSGTFIADNPHASNLNVETPTGTGKTIIAGLSYCLLRHTHRVNRVLVIVPTLEQKTQYAEDFLDEISLFGERVIDVISCDGSTRVHRYHRENKAEVFVATIQTVVSNPGYILDLMSSGSWMLVADEHHHYAVDKAWGDSLKSLSPSFTLAISATPLRRDRQYSIFGKPDIEIKYEDAWAKEEIRMIRAHVEHYFIDVSVEDCDEVSRVTTEWLRNEAERTGREIQDFSKFEIRKKVRYHGKYLSNIIPNALECLQNKRLAVGDRHQAIIFCMSCNHAKFVCDNFTYLGKHVGLSADWVGTGPNGRKDDENKLIIKRFKEGDLDILVQVGIAEEGFNVKTASVLVFLNLLRRSPKAIQQLGRGMRRNSRIPFLKDYCDVFVSYDTDLADLVSSLESEQKLAGIDSLEVDDQGLLTVERGVRFTWLPEWIINDVEYDRTEIITPWEIKQAREHALEMSGLTSNPELVKSILLSDNEEVIELLREAIRREKAVLSLDMRIKTARQNANSAVTTLASNVLKMLSPGSESYDKTKFKELVIKINTRLNRDVGCDSDTMTVDELNSKYYLAADINNAIGETKEIPEWLKL